MTSRERAEQVVADWLSDVDLPIMDTKQLRLRNLRESVTAVLDAHAAEAIKCADATWAQVVGDTMHTAKAAVIRARGTA